MHRMFFHFIVYGTTLETLGRGGEREVMKAKS